MRQTIKHLYLKLNGELAGFVLLNATGILKPSNWRIDQFFVLVKFQGKGLGKAVFLQVVRIYPRKWELPVLPENVSSLMFWQKVIGEYTQGKFNQDNIQIMGGFVHHQDRAVLSFETS